MHISLQILTFPFFFQTSERRAGGGAEDHPRLLDEDPDARAMGEAEPVARRRVARSVGEQSSRLGVSVREEV